MTATFLIRHETRGPVIQCLLCGAVSTLAGDLSNRYCARCHLFHDTVAEARRMHAEGATHDCGEWGTYNRECAICGRRLDAPPPLVQSTLW